MNYGDGETQSYSFDNLGNRIEKDDSGGSGPGQELSTFDAANRITSRGSQAYTSDADGNLLSDGARTYTWDSQNRLAQCVSTINGTTTTSTYTYGADGLRRSATVGGVTTYYAYDRQSCAQEYKPGANSKLDVSANYLMGPRGSECRTDESDISESFQSAAASSYFHQVGATGYANSYPVFADGPRAHTSWYVYDGLGSVVGTVDGKSLAYSPGPKRDVYGIPRTSATLPTPHGFVGALGHPTDPTGLTYMRARYYDPQAGRFISEDPSGNGQNWYIYCSGDPVNEEDRTGKDGELVSTLGASDISAIMDGIGSTMDLDLEGEVVDLSGVLNEQAKFIVRGLEGDKNTLGAGEWNYLAKQVAGTPGSFVKAWVRWNEQLEIFDYYLDADAGDVFEHATPNVGSVNY